MSTAIAIGVAATRAISTFVVGKLILVAFGPLAFSGHAQLIQLVAMSIPAGCGFLSLAISSAVASGNSSGFRRARRFALSSGLASALLLLIAAMSFDLESLAAWLFGDPGWTQALIALPLTMLAAVALSYHSAMLVGAGRGSDAALVDAAMALCGIVIALVAVWRRDLVWVWWSSVPTLGLAALMATWLWRRAPKHAAPGSEQGSDSGPRLTSFLLTGLAASAVAPTLMVTLRAEVLQVAGAMDAAAFVAAQRLAALVAAPVPVYVYMFLTSYLASSTEGAGIARVRALQWRVGLALAGSFAVMALGLPWLVPWVFAVGLEIPLAVFLLVSLGEGMRAVAAVQAQQLATLGRWRRYLLADAAFFAALMGGFVFSQPSALSLAASYALAGATYLAALTIMSPREPTGSPR
jgi:hypothetical protein